MVRKALESYEVPGAIHCPIDKLSFLIESSSMKGRKRSTCNCGVDISKKDKMLMRDGRQTSSANAR